MSDATATQTANAGEAPSEADIIASMSEDDPPEAGQQEPPVSEAASREETASQADGEGQQQEGEDADPPPDFWSAERKALWEKITDPEVRAAIKGHVDDASKAISSKMEEAAKARKEAEERAQQFERERAHSVAWWEQAGPQIANAIKGKWAGWTPEYQKQLAAENPAEYTRLKAEYDIDVSQFNQLAQRQEQERQQVEARAKEHHQRERAAEHTKLEAKYPAEFKGEKAQQTYDMLSKYVIESGVAPERVPNIYEAPVVEIVLKAYKYDQLQAKTSAVTTLKPAAQPVSTTPRRVTPGPARAGNQGSDAERQATERLRNGDATEDVLRLAFR